MLKPVERQGSSVTDKIRENPWILSTFVLGVVALVLLISSFSGGDNITGAAVASQEDVTQKVLDFLDTQVGEGNVEYVSTNVKNGLYEIIVTYQGTQVPVYTTLDGENLVQGVVPIKTLLESADNAASPAPVEIIDASADDDPVKGNKVAPVEIIEFSDFQCPFCGKFYSETYNQVIDAYVKTGKASLVFRDFPLSNIHPYAQKAAEASECADEQGKFWEYHNKLFENQEALSVDNLKQYAKDLKLNTAKFNECLDSGAMADEVQKDLDEGSSYGVTGTPAFFINGRLIAGAYPFSEFQKIIEEELAKKSG